MIGGLCFFDFTGFFFFGTKEKFASVGIKGSHVWSHDQGNRPNYVTNLPSGETG
jgi:hypothetical protein